MSDVEKYEEPNTVVPVELDTPLMRWAAESVQIAAVAVSLAKTSFVPKAFVNKPAEITAAILAGREMGMEPMTALRSINVIQGTPALAAVAMRGLVQGAGHRIWVAEKSREKAVVRGQRRGEEEVHESVWTLDRAKGLGLLAKDNWQKQPEAMLVARATAECARLTAADVMVGMPYAAEELADEAFADAPVTTRRRTVRRKKQEAAFPDVAMEPELSAPVEPAELVAQPVTGDADE